MKQCVGPFEDGKQHLFKEWGKAKPFLKPKKYHIKQIICKAPLRKFYTYLLLIADIKKIKYPFLNLY